MINCMHRERGHFHEGLTYMNFPIEAWREHVEEQVEEHEPKCTAQSFFAPMVAFARGAAEAGGGVLVHCFAGAHRAGTAGVGFLIAVEGLSRRDAVATAQRCRPIIDPAAHCGGHLGRFGESGFMRLLGLLERAHATSSPSLAPEEGPAPKAARLPLERNSLASARAALRRTESVVTSLDGCRTVQQLTDGS